MWAFLGAMVLYMATNTPSALYPVYERIYGITPFTVTTIYGMYAGTLIPTLVLVGSLAHIIGFRRLLALAWFAAALGIGIFALAHAPWTLYLARLVQGIAVGLATGGIAASFVALEPERNTRRASIALTLALSLGCAVGPIVGGVFVAYLPWPNRLVFVVLAVALAVLAAGFLMLPRDLGITGVRWRPRLPTLPDADRRPFLLACASSFIVWSAAALFLALAPSYFHEATGSTNPVLAGASAGLTFVSAGVSQLLLRAKDAWRLQRAGLVVTCLGLIALVTGGRAQLGWLILGSALIAGYGIGMVLLGSTNAVNELSAHRPDHASVFAAYFLASYCGSGIPIMGIGLLGNLIGTPAAVLIFGCLALALTVWWLLAILRRA